MIVWLSDLLLFAVIIKKQTLQSSESTLSSNKCQRLVFFREYEEKIEFTIEKRRK